MKLEQLTLNDFLRLSRQGKRVLVYQTLLADSFSPTNALSALAQEMADGALLESGLTHKDNGHYSYIAFDAMAEMNVTDGKVTTRINDCVTTTHQHPFNVLRKLMRELDCVTKQTDMPFESSAVGYICYESVKYFEKINLYDAHEKLLPDMQFKFFRNIIIFDHMQQKLLVGIYVDVDEAIEQSYTTAHQKINKLIHKIGSQNLQSGNRPLKSNKPVDVKVDISDAEFAELVKTAKKYIKQGDAFQIVPSRTFSLSYTATPISIYCALREISPAPFMFYLPQKNCVLLGASPERLISVADRCVTITPIAGTRKRDKDSDDNDIAHDLLTDKKEVAEHMMLVDLARNDIGAVAKAGSIKVKELKQVKHYSHVSHITSMVQGELGESFDALDALACAFPAGTLSGAPKYRAMQIISELEKKPRGLYAGVVCHLDANGNLNTCIAIRSAVLKEDGIAEIRAGCGVVHDSDPLLEAEETKHKAKGMLAAIALAERGGD